MGGKLASCRFSVPVDISKRSVGERRRVRKEEKPPANTIVTVCPRPGSSCPGRKRRKGGGKGRREERSPPGPRYIVGPGSLWVTGATTEKRKRGKGEREKKKKNGQILRKGWPALHLHLSVIFLLGTIPEWEMGKKGKEREKRKERGENWSAPCPVSKGVG